MTPGSGTVLRWLGRLSALTLLTGVVESVSRFGFERYLQERVFRPAGMSASSIAVEGRETPALARAYWRPRNETEPNFPIDGLPNVSGRYGSSGLVTTPADMVRLFIALQQGKLLRPDAVERWAPGAEQRRRAG